MAEEVPQSKIDEMNVLGESAVVYPLSVMADDAVSYPSCRLGVASWLQQPWSSQCKRYL